MIDAVNQLAANKTFEFDALREAKNYRDALFSEFAPYLAGNVLEVGAGIGQMSELLFKIPAIQNLLPIEPDPQLFSHLQKTFPGKELFEGTVFQMPSTKDWNVIWNVNVLEHIPDDEAELAAYYNLLKKTSGVLCLFVPARQ